MKKILWLLMMAVWGQASLAAVPEFYDTFDSYSNGASFVAPTNGWQASSAAAIVTNGGGYASNAVFMSDAVALTNTMSLSSGLKVWTDFRIKPALGSQPPNVATNTSSFACFFTSDGYVSVATPIGWQVCSNDIWGSPVVPATNGYAHMSVYQDYATTTQAVFLNDQLILQDAGFVGTHDNHSEMLFRNTTNSCWLDNVWVKTNIGPDTLTSNHNGDGLADAMELQLYGYACRTQYVGGTGYPSYGSITAAVAAARSRDSIYIPAGSYSENVIVSNAITFTGGVFTNSSGTLTVHTGSGAVFQNVMNWGTVNVDTNSLATFNASLACSNLIIRSGSTVTVASVTCSNVTVETNGRLNCLGAFSCSGVASFDTSSAAIFSGTVACSGTVSVATSAALSLAQNATIGSLYCTGTVSVGAGATATVSTTLNLPPPGHMDFTSGNFIFTPMLVNMTGTFSLSNNWGQGRTVTVSPGASCAFSLALTNPPLSSLYLYMGGTSTFQAVTCTNLTAEEGTRPTFLGTMMCVSNITLGQNLVSGFSNAVTCGKTLTVGTNSLATFNASLACSNLIIRSGSTVTVASVTCSNVTVETNGRLNCLGAFSCSGVASFDTGSAAIFSGTVACPGTVSVASGASVTFGQGATLGQLNVIGTLIVGAGQTVTVNTATVTGSVQVTGAGTVSVGTALNVTGSGTLSFASGRLTVPSGNVDMTGTFTISNTWGAVTAVTLPLPFSDDFESYAGNTVMTNLGFRGWAASDGAVTVQSGTGVGGGKAVVLSARTALSNSINSALATKVWTDYFIQPELGVMPVAPPTNSSSFLAYVNTNGYLVVAVHGGEWYVCSNQYDHTDAAPLQSNTLTRISVCQDLVHSTFAVFVASNLVAQGLSAPVNLSTYNSMAVFTHRGSAVLDNIVISTLPPSGTSDLNQNGIPDADEINRSEFAAFSPIGTVYSLR